LQSQQSDDPVFIAVSVIAVELRHRHTIGFTPSSPDGKWHTLKIKLEPDTSKIQRGPTSGAK
jgi:hypothetical protein